MDRSGDPRSPLVIGLYNHGAIPKRIQTSQLDDVAISNMVNLCCIPKYRCSNFKLTTNGSSCLCHNLSLWRTLLSPLVSVFFCVWVDGLLPVVLPAAAWLPGVHLTVHLSPKHVHFYGLLPSSLQNRLYFNKRCTLSWTLTGLHHSKIYTKTKPPRFEWTEA